MKRLFRLALIGLVVAACATDGQATTDPRSPSAVVDPSARPTPEHTATVTLPAAPSIAPTTAPTPTPPAVGAHAGAYEAIVTRQTKRPAGLDVVAVTVDGQERLIRHVDDYAPWANISADGWMALAPADSTPRFALFDLSNPTAAPRFVTHNDAIGTSVWGPNGLFATSLPGKQKRCCGLQIVNARDGSTLRLPDVHFDTYSPIDWASDGSGILRTMPDGVVTMHLDGTTTPGGTRLARKSGPRETSPDGTRLLYCLDYDRDCPIRTLPSRQVVTQRPDGTLTTWYDGTKGPDRVGGMSLASKGDTIWLLLDRVDGNRHTARLARLDAPGLATVVASVDVGEDVGAVYFSAISDDDSIFVIATDHGPAGEPTSTSLTMVDADGHATSLDDYPRLVPAALADTWPGEHFALRASQ